MIIYWRRKRQSALLVDPILATSVYIPPTPKVLMNYPAGCIVWRTGGGRTVLQGVNAYNVKTPTLTTAISLGVAATGVIVWSRARTRKADAGILTARSIAHTTGGAPTAQTPIGILTTPSLGAL